MKRLLYLPVIAILFAFVSACQASNSREIPEKDIFLSFFLPSSAEEHFETISEIDRNWKDEYVPLILEIFYFVQDPQVNVKLRDLLQKKTGKNFGFEMNDWYEYVWSKEENIPSYYPEFKAELHELIDRRFRKYFDGRGDQTRIRLDEVRWGGVLQDGIPPLRDPEMISVDEATYLDDDNVVFGIEVNGDVRAYPKRILAWHEMFVDEVGGRKLAGVYCTLCGTVILFDTEHNGVTHELGTSGFLYRSNKLMYDKATQSLWNTIWGEPVIGPLINKGIKLEILSVVTTTWGEWKKRHPDTKVLSLKTGHARDYGEGVAYHSYFATDQLMFNIPKVDTRLRNKDEVLAVRLNEFPDEQVAISARYLKRHPVYHDKIGNKEFVVLTDKTGGNRVYETNGLKFKKFNGSKAIDEDGNEWVLTESELRLGDKALARLPYHRSFWFGWYAAYPDTRLVR